MNIRKLVAIAFSAFVLTACNAAERENRITGTYAETELTLTEMITDESLSEAEEDYGIIELAVYNPYSDFVKVDDSTRRELTEAMKKILDGWAFFCASPDSFYVGSSYESSFADTEIVMESNRENDCYYSPLNPEIAETEDELIEYFHSVFSEEWTGKPYEEAIGAIIFDESMPYYKTIDGTLCMRVKNDGDLKRPDLDNIVILEYDEKSASIVLETNPPNGVNGRYFSQWEITKDEEYGWRMDSGGGVLFDELKLNCLYTLLLNQDRLNTVLSGKTDESISIIIDDEEYYLSEADMSIDEMRSFFTEIFYKRSIASEYYYENGIAGDSLCENYIREYIDEVYAEKDGELYRKASAPKWYLPEMKIRLNAHFSNSSSDSFTAFVLADGKSVPITIKFGIEVGGVKPLCFASGLPVKVLE